MLVARIADRWGVAVAVAVVTVLTAAGAQQAAAQTPSPPFDVSPPGDYPASVSLGPDGSGNTHFVWYRFGSAASRVETRRRGADGSLGPVRELAAADHVEDPEVAVDGAGNAHFAWITGSGYDAQAHTRRLGADGTLGPVVDLSPAGAPADRPKLAVDGADRVHFTWIGFDGTAAVAQTRRMDADGTLGPIRDLADPGSFSPELAVDGAGNAHFAWYANASAGSGWVARTRRLGADGTLGPVRDLTPAGQSALNTKVGVDGAGNAYFAWLRRDGSDEVAQARRLGTDGVMTSTQDLNAPSGSQSAPLVTVDSGGAAHVALTSVSGAVTVAQTRRMAADGSVGPAQTLGAAGDPGREPQLAADGDGRVHFVWILDDAADRAQARTLEADGTLGPLHTISASGDNVYEPNVAAHPAGDVAFAWTGSIGGASTIRAAVLDRTAPTTAIGSGPMGRTDDRTAVFGFGANEPGATFACKLDGPGGAVGIYAPCTSPATFEGLADGDYTFSVRATDAAGNQQAGTTTRAFTVAPAPPGSAPGAPPADGARDTVAPLISGARLSRSAFAVQTRGHASKNVGRGTRIGFRLSKAATVVFATQQRVGGRWRTVRVFGKRFGSGRVALDYSGIIKPRGQRRALRPARYRLRIRPSDRAGNRGQVTTLGFRILGPSR